MKEEEKQMGDGPYSARETEILNKVENIQLELLDGFNPKTLDDNEDKDMLLKVTKALSDNVHKRALNRTKHDVGTSMVETAENRQKFLQELHNQTTLERNKLANDEPAMFEPTIDAELIPEPVPGQLTTGIEKPTLKEIMETVIDDEE